MKLKSSSKCLLITLLFLSTVFSVPCVSASDFTATLSSFSFDQKKGTFGCTSSGTGDAATVGTVSGNFTVTSVSGGVAHVFFSSSMRDVDGAKITINGNMLVNFVSNTLATSSIELTWKKGSTIRKYTSVASGSFSSPNFSDLQLSASGTTQ